MSTVPTPYETNQVFANSTDDPTAPKLIRLVDQVALRHVVLIDADLSVESMPWEVSYGEWIELLRSSLQPVTDPHAHITEVGRSLRTKTQDHLSKVYAAINTFAQHESATTSVSSIRCAIADTARTMGCSKRTPKRWILKWLKAGRNAAAVLKATAKSFQPAQPKLQSAGSRRGVKPRSPHLASNAAAHEVVARIKEAYATYILGRGMTWLDAYDEMLLQMYKLPTEEDPRTGKVRPQLTPRNIAKFRIPSKGQFRYRVRLLVRADRKIPNELPKGKRGKATNLAFGPGYFEIDATFFQIQLVSRKTASKLVGTPCVYLIVDLFSQAITGYVLTLENASWAAASLALHNCFSDKKATFERLGLPYDSAEWPCRELPTVLRADRAELVSNMGHRFATCGVRVEITGSMQPEGKGTIEGKNSETKRWSRSRFDLPGLFKKYRQRREGNGKKTAALTPERFERILVEIILDLNRSALRADQIPNDAIHCGSSVASRIGLYCWGRENRPGFTSAKPPNFAFDHLLPHKNGIVKPSGVHLNGQVFVGDVLFERRMLQRAAVAHFKLELAYFPPYAGEVYFLDAETKTWVRLHNADGNVIRERLSFAECAALADHKKNMHDEARLSRSYFRSSGAKRIEAEIADGMREKAAAPRAPVAAGAAIRDNRATDRAARRSPGMWIERENEAQVGDISVAADERRERPDASSKTAVEVQEPTNDLMQLWRNINAKTGS